MDTEVVVVMTVAVVAWCLASARLDRRSITPALVFVVVGLVVANPPLSIIEIAPDSHTVRSLTEVTLALVLFSDAARVDVRRLRADARVPMRLLLIGLPLSVAVGVGLALAIFADLDVWVCAVIAAAVAPTDSALGAPLMAVRRIPRRIRRELNVESGLNDGLVTPIVTFAIAGAVAEVGARPDLSPGTALADLAIGLVAGVALGLAGGLLLRLARRRSWTASETEPLAVLALALLSYAAAVELGGNGFVAAFVGGLAFGATREATADAIEFASQAGELLAIAVWFVFGAIAVALTGTGMSRPTVAFIGWFGPRGLASVVFALVAFDELPADGGRSTMLAAIIATVLLSVVAHALTAKPLAGRFATYAHDRGRPADHRPTPEPVLRRRWGHPRVPVPVAGANGDLPPT